MKLIKKAKHFGLEDVIMFIAVFGSSALGAQIFGISLNKLALIPLEIWLIFKMKSRIRINSNQRILLLWYIFAILSCIVGGIYIKTEFSARLILYVVQVCLIYIPIIALLSNMTMPLEKFKRAIIQTAKINAIWALVQFLCWQFMKLDFNGLIFNDILAGALGTDWTVWTYENGTLGLRVSGLNSDTAFFAVLMLFGLSLDKSKIWKIIYFVACAFSLSRTGIVTLVAVVVIRFFMEQKSKISIKALFGTVAAVVLLIGMSIYLYSTSMEVQYQVNYIIDRFASLNAGASMDVGTLRHVQYIPVAIYIWLFEFSPIKKLIGVGVRVGGTAMISSAYAHEKFAFSPTMYSTAWSIECDVAELLMGHGIVGYLLLIIEYKLFKKLEIDYKICIAGLIIMGVMYGVIETTIVQLFFICAVTQEHSEKLLKV